MSNLFHSFTPKIRLLSHSETIKVMQTFLIASVNFGGELSIRNSRGEFSPALPQAGWLLLPQSHLTRRLRPSRACLHLPEQYNGAAVRVEVPLCPCGCTK